jgi:predicted phage terminase large subunit-like protein
VRMVADTTRMDGMAVRQGIEVVGAQVGFLDTLLVDPLLAAYSFEPIKVHADKLTRALPAVARCEQGRLAVVRGPWNRAFLDELSNFTGTEDEHDDQVDALSGATTLLGTPTGALSSASQLGTAPRNEWAEAVAGDRPRPQEMTL